MIAEHPRSRNPTMFQCHLIYPTPSASSPKRWIIIMSGTFGNTMHHITASRTMGCTESKPATYTLRSRWSGRRKGKRVVWTTSATFQMDRGKDARRDAYRPYVKGNFTVIIRVVHKFLAHFGNDVKNGYRERSDFVFYLGYSQKPLWSPTRWARIFTAEASLS